MQIKRTIGSFGFLHTGAPVHEGARGGQVKGLMISKWGQRSPGT